MNFADMHNDIDWEHNTEVDLQYVTLNDLLLETHVDFTHVVRAIHINTQNRYGDSAILITDGHKVNLPIHLTSKIKQILASPKSVQAIKDGKVGFDIVTYENEYGTQFSIKWVNVINGKK